MERSASFGDQAAAGTLLEAAREVAAQAPATAAHWLEAALAIMPAETAGPGRQVELLLEVAGLRAVSGQLAEGRDTAREVLRRLPLGDHARRAKAARFCALMERQLDRPQEARAVLLDELRRIPDPQSATAVPLRTRLVAESLMRGDVRAAQAVLDLIPENVDAHEPSVAVAIAALRPLPAYALGQVADAARFIEAAGELVAAAPDDHLAEWLDAVAWLCWTETMMGRDASALAHFERAVGHRPRHRAGLHHQQPAGRAGPGADAVRPAGGGRRRRGGSRRGGPAARLRPPARVRAHPAVPRGQLVR